MNILPASDDTTVVLQDAQVFVVPSGTFTTVIPELDGVVLVVEQSQSSVITIDPAVVVVPSSSNVTILADSTENTGSGGSSYDGPKFYFQSTPPDNANLHDIWIKI